MVLNSFSPVLRSNTEPRRPPKSDGRAKVQARVFWLLMKSRYAQADDTVPGQMAMVVVALATTAGSPTCRSAGKEMSEPPPATALTAPAASAAAASRR